MCIEQRSLIPFLLVFGAHVQNPAESHFANDVQFFEQRVRSVNRLNFPGYEVAQWVLIKSASVPAAFLLNPTFYLPPLPDYAAEGVGKFGRFSG
ncbi:Uncharacterised protein [Burkholderia pseudomallei]|nr:Uncharacterised protein [Burkholderia pseudomallei]CAJ9457649.1 Uncharacterised protein [Burkholderia pseudomallei]